MFIKLSAAEPTSGGTGRVKILLHYTHFVFPILNKSVHPHAVFNICSEA